MAISYRLPWHDPDWMKQAHDWIYAETRRQSIRITGDIEQPHLYPWSTVLIVPTADGRLFFKATAPETIYEAALTKQLGEWIPESMPELVAVDPVKGWMLMRDGGEQLRQSIRPTKDLKPWVPVIRRYAEVQIALVEQVPEILALGIPDYRLAALPSLYSDLLADEESLMIDQEKGLTAVEFQVLKEKSYFRCRVRMLVKVFHSHPASAEYAEHRRNRETVSTGSSELHATSHSETVKTVSQNRVAVHRAEAR